MVDSIASYSGGKNPCLHGNFIVKENEPVFYSNETESYWPSMYIIEGLGQCCNLLIVISAIEKEIIKAGIRIKAINDVLKELMDDEPHEITETLKVVLNQRQIETYSNVGFLGSTDIVVTGHVRQGQAILYKVRQNYVYGSLFHLTVGAYTNNNRIASGSLVGSGRK